MPCYQVRTVSVEFNAAHKDLLIKAIEKLNWRTMQDKNQILITNVGIYGIRIDLDNQTAEFDQKNQNEVNLLKRTYTGICIEEAAKRKRWALKATGEDKLQLKRY